MAETYLQTVETASSTLSLGVQPTSPVQTSAPIAQLIPILKAAYSTSRYILTLTLSLVRPFLIFSPIPILLYVFAPVLVFLQLVLTVFIWSPYKIALYFLDALYPLYVLCGVACITGGILGLIARLLSRVIVNTALTEKKEGVQADKTVKVKAEEEDSQQVDAKGKGKKVERVKFES